MVPSWYDILISTFARIIAGLKNETLHNRLYAIKEVVFVQPRPSLLDLLCSVVSDFVNAPLEDVRANVGDKKNIARTYRDIKQNLRLPTHVVDGMYRPPWVTHFYTDDEVASFKRRWTRTTS